MSVWLGLGSLARLLACSLARLLTYLQVADDLLLQVALDTNLTCTHFYFQHYVSSLLFVRSIAQVGCHTTP